MKSLFKLLFIAILFYCSAVAWSQPTITFTPSSGTIISYDDVTKTLASNGITRDSAFNAIIENATTIGVNAFVGCNLLTIDLGDVITIQPLAFVHTPLTTISSAMVDTI